MKVTTRKTLGLVLAFSIGAIVACNGTSTASTSGPTMAQFTALQTQVTNLESAVAALKANQGSSTGNPAVWITGGKSTSALAQQAEPRAVESNAAPETSACPGIGTLTGRPNSGSFGGNTFTGISCTGYYFGIQGSMSKSIPGLIQGLGATGLFAGYDGAQCTGNAYLIGSKKSWIPIAIANGLVFTLDNSTYTGEPTDVSGYSNANIYFYIPAGEAATPFTMASIWTEGEGCLPASSKLNPSPIDTTDAYLIHKNDPSITGVQSAPVPGPVLISTGNQ